MDQQDLHPHVEIESLEEVIMILEELIRVLDDKTNKGIQ